MDTQTRGPRLLSGIRKYGRYENLERFDNRSSHASIGSKSIGKINIDCQLLFKKSHWGVLDEGKVPAGIIYLNLNFGPPQGCRLKSATVTVTLDEEASCLTKYCSERALHSSGCPVQMTEWYGPRGLAGESKTADITQTIYLAPEVTVLGNGVGGVGGGRNKAFKHTARWSFSGQLLRGPGKQPWTYKSLRWDLNENELESQSFHSNKVQTAFTFQHSGQPFLMSVDIDGTLEKWNDRIKSKLKFGADEGKAVTLVDFENYATYQKSLDLVASGLPRTMEMLNLQEIPIEVPDSLPGATFQPTQTPSYVEDPSQISEPPSSAPMQSRGQPGAPALIMAEQTFSSHEPSMLAGDDCAQSAQELMRALRELKSPDLYRFIPEDRPVSSTSTVVGSEEGPVITEIEANTKRLKSNSNTELTVKSGLDEEALSKILELPLIIMILRLLANILKLTGNKRELEQGPQREGSIASGSEA